MKARSGIETRLNGQVMQRGNTADLFPVSDLIATISEAITLEPGDVIVPGTPAGIGSAAQAAHLHERRQRCAIVVGRMHARESVAGSTRDIKVKSGWTLLVYELLRA